VSDRDLIDSIVGQSEASEKLPRPVAPSQDAEMPLAKTSSFPLCPDRRPGPSLSGNASVVSDAPHDRWAGRLGKSGGARPIQLFEGSRPWAGGDSMQFESTLASKALPGREFSHNPVIDSHRYMSSLQPCALSYLGAIRSSRGKIRRMCLYTRKRLPRSGFLQTGFWEVTNLVRPKPREKPLAFTPLLVSVADDAA
jgi:hypothetical protein